MEFSTKNAITYTILLCYILIVRGLSEKNMTLTDEQRLLAKLMKGYDKSVRPVFSATTPVVISLGLTLTQILNVDEKEQVLVTNIWLDQSWSDEKMLWNPSDYGGIQVFRIPCDFLWLPDIVLYNSVDSYGRGYMKSLAMVSCNGTIFWPPIVRMRSSCKMDITYFPFDDQICKLKLGSWAYDGFQVDVINSSDVIDTENFVDNGEWTLMGTRTVRTVKSYPCCPEPFPDVTFYIHIRRRVLYYGFNVMIPCMLLSGLSLTSFCLPPESGEKITLGLTVLLAFSVFMLLIAENMPATSEFVPLIGVYLTVIMAMSTLSVVFSVIILNIHHKGSQRFNPPRWLQKVAYFIGRLLCMQFIDDAQHILLQQEAPRASSESFHSEGTRKETFCNGVNHINVVESTLGNESTTKTASAMAEEEVTKFFHYLASSNDRRLTERKMIVEWQRVARVMDRLFFIIFMTINVVSTFVILVINPSTKNINLDTDLPR